MLLQQAPAPHREGELLIRFRNGVSDRTKQLSLLRMAHE
jgi:hypothetical protein